ncbi:hypothetical protein BU15DRAFT_48987 [Melanogaster broomeanus]|nr:hypothetical protein BU15DRAFT_48987 [Melanogaster broomeanus]
MRQFTQSTTPTESPHEETPTPASHHTVSESFTFTGYLSDASEDGIDDVDDTWGDTNSESDFQSPRVEVEASCTQSGRLPAVPPLKRRKLDIPLRLQGERAREVRGKELREGLAAINKLVKSQKTEFVGGPHGLQARRARTIQTHLELIAKNGRFTIDASERAAEAHGFAAGWGGRQVRSWSRVWLATRMLPQSFRGRHAKVYSLLKDPTIAGELRTYVRSHKWAMDPAKLIKFTKSELIPHEAEKYAKHIINTEMPHGLKQYLELELFPRMHLKVIRGVSLSTARRWLPNDAVDRYWVLEDQFRLRKKGAGRGIHRSDVICSTVGHMVDAGQSMEYGKNYDGYWTGELFVKQLSEQIIPTFEKLHGPGYQALFLIDNSQGHSAYAENALVCSRMNVNSGGQQACMRNGWFIKDHVRVSQPMVFLPDHAEFPNKPKGIKVYLRDHCDYTFTTLKENLPLALDSVQLNTIRLWEHRMHRWMEAYRSGLETNEAQMQVKKFSSTKYKSHRRIPETVAQLFDHM